MKKVYMLAVCFLLTFGSCSGGAYTFLPTIPVRYEVSGTADIGVVDVTLLDENSSVITFRDQNLPYSYSMAVPLAAPGTVYLAVMKNANNFNPLSSFGQISLKIYVDNKISRSLVRPDTSSEGGEINTKPWNGAPIFIKENILDIEEP